MIASERANAIALRRTRPRWRDESGKAGWRGIVALLLVGLGVYLGMKLIPVRASAYQFADSVRDEVVFANTRRRSDDAIRQTLVRDAEELGLPVTSKDVVIKRWGRRNIKVEVSYTVDIEFIGGYTYSWHFSPSAQGLLF